MLPTASRQALESDTKVLAYEAGRKYKVRVNTISAGPLGSRAAKAIGFIDDMIRYSYANAPVQKELAAQVGFRGEVCVGWGGTCRSSWVRRWG
jgi:enoyl-[acyl-carrier protein] reductase I